MAAPPPDAPNGPKPPLTEAQKKAEYEMVKVEETLTPAQIKQRDIIPGWRPIPPLSDIQRAAIEIVPGEPNPFLVRRMWPVGGWDLTPKDLNRLGPPSRFPQGFASRVDAGEGYWYEQIDDAGQMTGVWMVVVESRVSRKVEAWALAGALHMGEGVYYRIGPAVDVATAAVKHLTRTLSGTEPPSPEELLKRLYEKRARMLKGEPR